MNRAFFGSALATLLFAGQAPAQPYPSRPVTFIVPYGLAVRSILWRDF